VPHIVELDKDGVEALHKSLSRARLCIHAAYPNGGPCVRQEAKRGEEE
jgi:hypothetical protein